MNSLAEKLNTLRANLANYHSAVVAFSGGVDSSYLALAAKEVFGDRLLLVTATSSTYPFFELDESKKIARELAIEQKIIVSEEIDIPGFADNPPDRCYYCKNELFSQIRHIASQEGFEIVCDGSNADDASDFRPGKRALREQGVISPLLDAGLTKDEIRELSRRSGLSTAGKPSFACLASRFPYGEKITKEKLDRVAQAEHNIRGLEFRQFRVRSHGDIARLEFASDELDRAFGHRENLEIICRGAGFTYTAIDLRGYRTGAMNEGLSDVVKQKSLDG